jgi:hypothetical protein
VIAGGDCARGEQVSKVDVIKQIAGVKSVDVLVPVKRGSVRPELRLRVVATPEPATAQLLAPLGLRLPKGTIVSGKVSKKRRIMVSGLGDEAKNHEQRNNHDPSETGPYDDTTTTGLKCSICFLR